MLFKFFFGAVAAFAVFFGFAEAARILAILPTASPSHHIWNRALTIALAKRGHHVTVLSPDPEKEPVPNLKDIHLEGSYELIQEVFDLEGMVKNSPIQTLEDIWTLGLEICKFQAESKPVQDLIMLPPDSFDLIIVESVFSECLFMLLHHFGVGTRIPAVGMTAFGMGPWTDIITGGKTMPSVYAFPVMPYLSKMNFFERLYNTIITGIEWIGMIYYYMPKQQRTAEKAYGKPLPPLHEIASNITINLVNNHYALNGPQALLPGIIEVGGMQCSPAKPLPSDIKAFMDESEKGAILFSLGSNLKSELLPKERLQTIMGAFAALGPKIRVVWKFDPKVPIKGLPSNVLIKKWLPQEDILGHHKLLAFVSHGGLLSTQEAIYHGVPVVCVPFFADQHTNARRLETMKVAKRVDFLTMTKDSFLEAILSIINDTSYHQNMQRVSKLFRDQPETPLDRAIFWTEFTLRHDKGRVHSLRSAALDLAWYQYFSLDIIALLLLAAFLVMFIAMLILYTAYKLLMKSLKTEDSLQKLKKQ